MAIHLSRRIWTTLEPLHDVTYFGAGVKEAGLTLGLRGFWQTYFAFRAAPLGAVRAGTVVAAFAGFHPQMVAKALPDAWNRTSPQQCLDARLTFSAELLRAAGAGDAECGRAVELLTPVLRTADPTGRALYAANAELPLPDDPVAALWQLATSLREHRGDGHIAALVANGVSGPQALVLQVAAGKAPESVMRLARGWSEREWSDFADELRARGLIVGEPVAPALTGTGAELLERVEMSTDEAAWNGALSALSHDAATELTATLAPLVERVQQSVVPPIKPIGMSRA